MNITYFSSKNVKIFPCANRGKFATDNGSFDPESRVVSEHNFTRIPGILPGRDSYKISYTEADKILRCVIHGYYIEITGLSKEPDTGYLILSTKTYQTAVEAEGKDSNRYSEHLCDLASGTATLDKTNDDGEYIFTALGRSDNELAETDKAASVNYYYLDLTNSARTVAFTTIDYKDNTLIITT